MFTGIIEKIGKVSHVTEKNISQVIGIRIEDFNSALGDSICINGVCLTVEDIDDNVYSFSISPETYKLSNFKNIKENDDVNIERSLTIDKLLSGHIIQGHVDTCSEITELKKIDNSWYVKIKIDSTYMKYIIQKGSITIDGVSLTVNEVYTDEFSVMVIPHTYSNTIFRNYKIGSILNTEIDILAKYIEKLGNKE